METKNELRAQADKYFEQACAELKINNMLPDVSFLPERNQKAILAFYKLSVIIQWVNKGWEPNWQDWEERKYFPWFEVLPAGLGCSFTSFAASYTTARALIGSRLCFKSAGLAAEWAQKLLPLYEDYMLLN